MPSVERPDNIFRRFESRLTDYTGVKKAEDELAFGERPHVIKLPKGAFPYKEKLTPYQKWCRTFLGDMVDKFAKYNPALESALIKAQMGIRYEDYIAIVWMNTIIAVGAWIGLSVALGVVIGLLGGSGGTIVMVCIMLAMLPLLVFAFTYLQPTLKARSRKNNIDKRISYAMSFIAAMASADVNVDVIFKELARQPIYGEIQKEAQWITRDIDLLGIDTLTALIDAASRSPSQKFQDFLQGVVTTTLSGGQLKPYFLMKSEQYVRLAKLEGKKNQETLGMLAESFVTVVVAMPLFLIVMMSLMALVGKTAGSSILLLYMIVFIMIPFSQLGFIVAIQSMTEEAK